MKLANFTAFMLLAAFNLCISSITLANDSKPVAPLILSLDDQIFNSPENTPANTAGDLTFRIFSNFSADESSGSVLDSLSIERMKIITENRIIVNGTNQQIAGVPNNFVWSQSRVDQALSQSVPANYTGYICLDWETPFHDLADSNSTHHKVAVEQMTSLLRYVKQQRPGAKLGYYGIPLTEYWPVFQELRNGPEAVKYEARTRKLASIIQASDVIFPTMYDFYTNAQSGGPQRDNDIFGEIARISIKVSEGKPVVPFIWDRFHDGGSAGDQKFRTIPETEYKQHLRGILDATHDGRRVAGIMLWGADEWFHQQAFAKDGSGAYRHNSGWAQNLRKVFSEECSSFAKANECIDSRKVRTYEYVVDVMSEFGDDSKTRLADTGE